MQNPLSTFIIETETPDQTRAIAEFIGRNLTESTLIFLTGELGAGKTAFVQGLATGLGVPENAYVTSPTYTIVNEHSGRMELIHADLYRLGDPEELMHIGLSEMLGDNVVMAVEWPENGASELPPPDLVIQLEHHGANCRKIHFSPYGLALANLIQTATIKFS